jgi:hypothetical protein
MAGLFCSGSFIHLSLPTCVPTVPIGSFLEILDEQKCSSITIVNMQYARFSTKAGGLLLPSANYHVMLGRTMDETIQYANRIVDKTCAEDGFDIKFEQSSMLDEALTNGCSLARGTWLGLNQFIAEKVVL